MGACSDLMPGAEWLPGARLNYAAHMMGRAEDTTAVAVVARSQSREPFELTLASCVTKWSVPASAYNGSASSSRR